MLFPSVQEKAQAEIDRVVGPDRLPTFDDQLDMPYLRAVVLETLRWSPSVPTGAFGGGVTRSMDGVLTCTFPYRLSPPVFE